jgi:hypothetical protein
LKSMDVDIIRPKPACSKGMQRLRRMEARDMRTPSPRIAELEAALPMSRLTEGSTAIPLPTPE